MSSDACPNFSTSTFRDIARSPCPRHLGGFVRSFWNMGSAGFGTPFVHNLKAKSRVGSPHLTSSPNWRRGQHTNRRPGGGEVCGPQANSTCLASRKVVTWRLNSK